MQQGAGSQYGVSPEMSPFGSATGTRTQIAGSSSTHQQQGVAEEASPISSRPPAHSSTGNFDELLPVAGGLPDDDALAAGDEPDRGGISGGNRWPRQETLALLKIRSDMDVVFRDASLKGPLWEEVSRKLAELGYKRSAKKCKEKFENVHKYYKRTKEGRAGRQDGKSYRFFSQLEALHTTPTTPNIMSPVPAAMISTPAVVVTTATNTNTNTTAIHIAPTNLNMVTPVSMGIGGISSVRIPPSTQATPSVVPSSFGASPMFPPGMNVGASGSAPITGNPVGISFSSNSSSSFSSGSEEEEEDDLDGDPSNTDSSRGLKRKRGYSSSKGGGESSSKRMMEFFEGLMKQVMQKQETMQQRFLEIIEKREQDRMIREEAWRRQEMARLSREQEVMAQERAISASRDAAIIAFLQKITGQTIQLPSSAAVTISAAPPPPPTPGPPPPSSHPAPHLQIPQQQQQQHQQQQQPQQQHQQHLHQHQVQSQITEVTRHQSQSQPQVTCTDIVMAEVVRHQTQPPVSSSDIIVAVPEQQLPPEVGGSSGGGSFDPTSSRWPKVEVLALIKLRSGLEGKYQEAGPKGPLWEEISAGMQRMGYKRSAKRCKEKWENINKYFKKVKESNKKRPQDAKTCPYFHELDALYRRKILGGGGGSGSGSSSQTRPEQQQQQQQQQPPQQPQPQPQQQQERMVLDPIQTQALPAPQLTQQGVESEKRIVDTNIDLQARNGGFPANLFGEGSNTGAGGSAKKPEDIVKELMGQQQLQQQQQQQRRELMMDEYEKMDEQDSDNLDEDEYDDDDEDSGDDNGKLRYKIEFQRQNAAGGSSNGSGGNGTPSFAAMVQ